MDSGFDKGFRPYDNPLRLDDSNPLFAVLLPEQQAVFKQFDSERIRMQQDISKLAREGREPGAHGTSSNYLPSILEYGLGAVMPVGTLAGTKSTTDATTADGMLGAYLFAKGLRGDLLAIRREEVDPEGDALKRYTQLSPRIPEAGLRVQIEKYFQQRAAVVGSEYESAYPVLLVMAAEQGQMSPTNQQAVPSERKFDGILSRDKLALICVPEQFIADTQQLIGQYGLSVTVRAIEPLELF